MCQIHMKQKKRRMYMLLTLQLPCNTKFLYEHKAKAQECVGKPLNALILCRASAHAHSHACGTGAAHSRGFHPNTPANKSSPLALAQSFVQFPAESACSFMQLCWATHVEQLQLRNANPECILVSCCQRHLVCMCVCVCVCV